MIITIDQLPGVIPEAIESINRAGITDIWTLAAQSGISPHDAYRSITGGWYYWLLLSGPDEMAAWLIVWDHLGIPAKLLGSIASRVEIDG